MSFPFVDGKEVCRVTVAPGKAPVFCQVADKSGAKSEKLYVRDGNASPSLDSASQLAAYINKRFPGYGG